MIQTQKSKQSHYDLEERTLVFARKVNAYVNVLPKTITNIENGKQLVRACSTSNAEIKSYNFERKS